MKDILLVSIGAIFGVNTRFLIHHRLRKLEIISNNSILLINILSSFSLGLFLSILPRISPLIFYYELVLFFSIGFLGSLSTFSTFVYDLYDLFLQFNFSRALKNFSISLTLGIISLVFGFFLGNL